MLTKFIEIYEKELKENPIVLVDVGASGGMQKNWKKMKCLKVIGFEPDERAETPDMRCLKCLLNKEKKEAEFYMTRNQKLSSLYKPNKDFLDGFPEADRFDIVKKENVKCDTIDNQINGMDVDFIKLDAQGGELNILEGSEKILKHVLGVEVEVEFSPIYEGQPLFSDVDQFMRRQGFELFDLRPHYWKRKNGIKYGKGKGRIIFADALYFRKPSVTRMKIIKSILVALLYGYVDYAYELFLENKKLFSTDEKRKISALFEKTIQNIPNFKGRGKIAAILKDIASEIEPGYGGWATSGKLGNV